MRKAIVFLLRDPGRDVKLGLEPRQGPGDAPSVKTRLLASLVTLACVAAAIHLLRFAGGLPHAYHEPALSRGGAMIQPPPVVGPG
jgi:hypothetical protein